LPRPFLTFPTSLTHYRELAQLNQRTLAERVGIAQPELSLIESGYCLPRPDVAAALAAALDAPEPLIWPEDVRTLYVNGGG
jgi:transcriptional regulator with XRE-family HTH domain